MKTMEHKLKIVFKRKPLTSIPPGVPIGWGGLGRERPGICLKAITCMLLTLPLLFLEDIHLQLFGHCMFPKSELSSPHRCIIHNSKGHPGTNKSPKGDRSEGFISMFGGKHVFICFPIICFWDNRKL